MKERLHKLKETDHINERRKLELMSEQKKQYGIHSNKH